LCLKFQHGSCTHSSSHTITRRDGSSLSVKHLCAASGCNAAHGYCGNH
jgi:hypothetical protein